MSDNSLTTPASAGGEACAGMFSGIGGLELGLGAAGFDAKMLCESDPHAQGVLASQFNGVEVLPDIQKLKALPDAYLLAAGFPCQDLSQAGRTTGISGAKSGIVQHLFTLLDKASVRPEWLLIENVPFMLKLNHGAAIAYVTSELERLGYVWAYRVVDSRAFGVPQRRRRVYLLASRTGDPRVIHVEDAGKRSECVWDGGAVGFYWTEGNRGLGWVPGGVPTLKGGSSVGIPSAPAIWLPDGTIGTPDIRDAERLQGFEPDWTASVQGGRAGIRWRLVGNAVTVPVAEWVGGLVASPPTGSPSTGNRMDAEGAWPDAAWGASGERYAVVCSAWPRHEPTPDIADFLEYPLKPLSLKATLGFNSRLLRSTLRRPKEFDDALKLHIDKMQQLT